MFEELLEVVEAEPLMIARMSLVAAENTRIFTTHVSSGSNEVAIVYIVLSSSSPIHISIKSDFV